MNSLSTMLRKVRAVVVRSGVAPQDADDVVHEAFVRLESYARKQEIRSREAFLVTAAVNLGRDQARRRARMPLDDAEFDILSLADAAPLPEEQLLSQERLRRIGSGMQRLDPQTRRILMAKRLDGLTAAQIARNLRLHPSRGCCRAIIRLVARCRVGRRLGRLASKATGCSDHLCAGRVARARGIEGGAQRRSGDMRRHPHVQHSRFSIPPAVGGT